MNTVSYVRWVIVIALITTLPLALRAHAQIEDGKVFAAIPAESRTQLIERLNLYVTSQRTADYEALYDLYTQKTISQVFGGQNKAEFSAAFRKGDEERKSVRLLAFTPKRIEKTTEDEVDLYKIYGKATLLQQGETVKRDVAIEAHLQNGTWYFSAIAVVQRDYGN